jgi:hypothetical protein
MRLLGAAALVVATRGAWAAETVCMNPGGNAATTYRAEGIAVRILKDAGVRIEFKDEARSCAALRSGIVISVSERTSASDHPGALAYAMPFERTRIVVFYDRILVTVLPRAVPSLLGHVLAHEIAHMLQGIEHHSSTGVMKEKWDHNDYAEMQRHDLRFTEEDLLLIRQGLRIRASSKDHRHRAFEVR